jgi:small subunit ribosomal protein S16
MMIPGTAPFKSDSTERKNPVSSTKLEEYRSNYMVRIRLRRTGKKKQASYRVVVADKESPRDGRFIETIGHYNPRTDPPTVVIKADRALYWLSQGAQPSDPVARMLKKQGIMAHFEAYKRGEPLPTAEELAAAAQAEDAEPEVVTEVDAETAAAVEAEVEEAETEETKEAEAEEAEASEEDAAE